MPVSTDLIGANQTIEYEVWYRRKPSTLIFIQERFPDRGVFLSST